MDNKDLKEIRKDSQEFEKELELLRDDVAKLKKIEKNFEEKYEELLKKEEAFLSEVNEQIEREITVVVLGSVKKTINKEMLSLKLLRRHIRKQVRHQVTREIKQEVKRMMDGLRETVKEEVKQTSLEIMNQLKRQTGKQLEKEVKEQVKETTSILREQKEDVERKAVIDELTGVFNRRYFETRLEEELTLARRFRTKLCLVMFDIDHFKKVNDTYGHQAGDTILQEVTEVAKASLSSVDAQCRYGGEEFCIIMPETEIEEAIDIAEKVRESIETHAFYGGDTLIKVTISLGIAEYPTHATMKEALIEKADKALYNAKQTGRNNTKIAIK